MGHGLKSGEAFISNAGISGKYALRFCICLDVSTALDLPPIQLSTLNFRASAGEITAMPQVVVHLRRQAHAE